MHTHGGMQKRNLGLSLETEDTFECFCGYRMPIDLDNISRSFGIKRGIQACKVKENHKRFCFFFPEGCRVYSDSLLDINPNIL